MKDVFLFISAKLIEGCYPDNQRRKENRPNESADADLPTGTWPTSSNEGASLTPAQHCKRKLESGFHMRCQSATQWPALGTIDSSILVISCQLLWSLALQLRQVIMCCTHGHRKVSSAKSAITVFWESPGILAISKFYMTRIIKCFGCSQHIFW